MVGVRWITEKGRIKLWLLLSWSALSGTAQLLSCCSLQVGSFQSKLWGSFAFFCPLFFKHHQTQTACEMHLRQATVCQNLSLGNPRADWKRKHKKSTPLPLPNPFKNKLMIKADLNNLTNFRNALNSSQISQLQALAVPAQLTLLLCCEQAPAPSGNAGSIHRSINNSGNAAIGLDTGPGLQALIYIASKSSSFVYYFTITSLVSLNWQALLSWKQEGRMGHAK